MNTITAGTLRVGRANSGNLSVSAAIAPAGTNTLSLLSGGSVTQTAAIAETNLRVSAVGPVTLTNAVNDVTTVAANVPGGGFSYTDANGFTVGTVDTVVGVTAAGNVALTSQAGGALTVADGITTTNNGTVTLTNAGALAFNANIIADGAVLQNGAGTVTTGGVGTRSITTTGDNVTINQAVTLGSDLTVDTQSAVAGNVTFSNTINGGSNLVVNTGGTTTFAGAIGNTTALASITTNAAGTTAINGGTLTTTGAQTYNDAVTLGANTTLNAGAGNITFGNTVNGAQSLTANSTGATTFLGAVGNTTALTSLTTNVGGTTDINGGRVTTTGAQTYNDAVLLSANTTLNAGAGAITFGNTVNSTTGNNFTLTANSTGTTTFGGAVGGTDALSSLTTNVGGTTALNGGSVTTIGAQTYNDAIALGVNTTLSSTGNGAITLGSTVDGAQSLTVNTGGATTFAGIVGGTTPLTTITTDAPGSTALNGGFITTTGAQTFNDAVTLGTNTRLHAGAGSITFGSTVNGAQSLTANSTGMTTFAGAVGNLLPLASVTTNAGGATAINGSSVTTSGNQTYGDNVTMNQATTLASTAGTVTFGGNATNTAAGAAITVDAPTINLTGGTTVATTGNGPINFFTDTLNSNEANINAGTGAFALAPNVPTKTVEFGDVNTGRVTDVYYSSNFGSVIAGSFTIGRPTHTGNIFVTGVAAAPSVLNIVNGGAGSVTFENAPYVSGNQNFGVASGSGGINLGTDLTIGTGTLRLTSTGAITQTSGTITADTLGAAAATGITLAQPTNNVTMLAAQTTAGNLAFTDTNGFVIGSVGATPDGFHPAIAGLTASAGDIALQSGGAVTQSAAITASGLSLQGSGPYTLTNPANDVTTLAANTTGAIQYRDANTLTVGSVGAISGITSSNNDVALITGGALTLNQGVNAGIGNLGLSSNGPVTQGGAGAIMANNLNLQGNGPYVLTNGNNDVTTLGGTTAGNVQYTDINSLTLGTVPAVGSLPGAGGLTSTGGNITVTNNTGNMTLSFVNAPAGSINLTATTGSILGGCGAGPHFTAGANSTLQAPVGIVGTQTAPINVLVNGGTLGILAGSQIGGISGFLTGAVAPVNALTILAPPPPGLVCFNACPPPATGGTGLLGLPGLGLGSLAYFNRDAIVPAYYPNYSRATQITQVASEYVPVTVMAASDANIVGDQQSVARGGVPPCVGCIPGSGILTAPAKGTDPEAPKAGGAAGACRQRDELKKGQTEPSKDPVAEEHCEELPVAK